MKKALLTMLAFTLFMTACNKDDNPTPEPEPTVELKSEINDFIWKGLNDFYLWKDNVSNLADTKDDIQNDYYKFLNSYDTPEKLFESLIYNRSSVDKYSWIVDDYVALEQRFSGVSKSNGVEYRLSRIGRSDDLFGFVRYILPNSDASNKDIKRGDFFLQVDGQNLTIQNYRNLLFGDNDTYELGLAKIEDNTISLTGEKVSLTKSEYTENPVYITKTFDIQGKKIGYLMYNSFTFAFDEQLNNAFAELKTAGVTDLVLDLRYNGGGRVSSAVHLASMITGQFNNQLFAKERWNPKWQNIFETQRPDLITNNFTNRIRNENRDGSVFFEGDINSLNLTKLYVLVSEDTASASELIINGLSPYIDVVIIGEQTEGKYIGSITLYDSDNFFRNGKNLNTNHKYAMQPITLEIVNKLGENDKDGFEPSNPNLKISEDILEMGVLGDRNEPLLKKALDKITGAVTKTPTKTFNKFRTYEKIKTKKSDELYLEKDIDFYSFISKN